MDCRMSAYLPLLSADLCRMRLRLQRRAAIRRWPRVSPKHLPQAFDRRARLTFETGQLDRTPGPRLGNDHLRVYFLTRLRSLPLLRHAKHGIRAVRVLAPGTDDHVSTALEPSINGEAVLRTIACQPLVWEPVPSVVYGDRGMVLTLSGVHGP